MNEPLTAVVRSRTVAESRAAVPVLRLAVPVT